MRFSIIMFVLAAFLQSCADKIEDNNILSCSEKILKENNMVSFTGVEPYCESIWAYEYEGKEYYCIDNCTADRICSLFDCDNVYIFHKGGTKHGEFDMEKFKLIYDKMISIGIIGIRQ